MWHDILVRGCVWHMLVRGCVCLFSKNVMPHTFLVIWHIAPRHVTWLAHWGIRKCKEMRESYRFVDVCDMTRSMCVTWLTRYVRHDSLTNAIGLSDAHVCVRQSAVQSYGTWMRESYRLVDVCAMTHSICETWSNGTWMRESYSHRVIESYALSINVHMRGLSQCDMTDMYDSIICMTVI